MKCFVTVHAVIELPETSEEFTLYALTTGTLRDACCAIMMYCVRFVDQYWYREFREWLNQVQEIWCPDSELQQRLDQFSEIYQIAERRASR